MNRNTLCTSQQSSRDYKSFEFRSRRRVKKKEERKKKKRMHIIARVKKEDRNWTIFLRSCARLKRKNTRVSLYDVSNKRLLNVDGREEGREEGVPRERNSNFILHPREEWSLRPRSRKSVHSSLRRLSQAIRKTSRTHLR